jgi:predicted DNA-binding antitoxin AbrB/MazE fold protein
MRIGMLTPIRAVYENGHLRLLHSVPLADGQEIDVVILTERERAVSALGELAVPLPHPETEDIDEAALLRAIDEAYRGKPSVSDAIIEERREGP